MSLGLLVAAPLAFAADRPNIVLIYADDLGFGDVSCNGAKPGLTPNVDRLARQGLNFTDAHSTSATCTPSRYALLTGEYPWRRQGTGVLPGDARLIIEPGRATLASVLKAAGHRTGVVGKWHLGLGGETLDWNGEIKPGTSKALVSQVDLIASFASLVRSTVRLTTPRDSRDQLATLLGADPVGRESLIEHAGGLAVRRGN
jgi:hypothetical protein